VFDDSFSALDMKTDQTLRKAISEKLTDVTKIIVGQRISTIKDANQILVISSGKIVGHGTHKHLLNKCKEYRDIALSQMTRKEVEHAANA
jgi:ABC-type multidrug transport system fused ATPase/permease subunit